MQGEQLWIILSDILINVPLISALKKNKFKVSIATWCYYYVFEDKNTNLLGFN